MRPLVFAVLFGALMSSGCSHRAATVAVPPAPSTSAKSQPTVTPKTPDLEVPSDAKPLLTETGIASWYGAPYHNRRGSNGEVYDMNSMQAVARVMREHPELLVVTDDIYRRLVYDTAWLSLCR